MQCIHFVNKQTNNWVNESHWHAQSVEIIRCVFFLFHLNFFAPTLFSIKYPEQTLTIASSLLSFMKVLNFVIMMWIIWYIFSCLGIWLMLLLLISPMHHAIQCHTFKQNLIKQNAISCTAWYAGVTSLWSNDLFFVSKQDKFVYPKSNIYFGVWAYYQWICNAQCRKYIVHCTVYKNIYSLLSLSIYHVKYFSFFFSLGFYSYKMFYWNHLQDMRRQPQRNRRLDKQ